METLNEAEIATGMAAMHYYIVDQWRQAVRLFDAGDVSSANDTVARVERAVNVYNALLHAPFKMAF
jgi:hypothetical protein